MKLVFNDLSLSLNNFRNIYESRLKMDEFVKLCQKAVLMGSDRELLTTIESFELQKLSEGYRILDWLNDRNVSRDAQRYLRSLLTKPPKIKFDTPSNIENLMLGYEFKYNSYDSHGLGLSYLLNGLSLSLDSSPQWTSNNLNLEKSWFDEEIDDISYEAVNVNHANNLDTLETHQQKFEISKRSSFKNGKEFWAKKIDLYPNLIFCENAKEHILNLSAKDALLSNVVKTLSDLDAYASSWSEGDFNSNEVRGKVTTDSTRTLERYDQERKIICPDGTIRLFSWHSRVTPQAWRIFFYPDFSSRKLIIGHIGPKLRTVTDH